MRCAATVETVAHPELVPWTRARRIARTAKARNCSNRGGRGETQRTAEQNARKVRNEQEKADLSVKRIAPCTKQRPVVIQAIQLL